MPRFDLTVHFPGPDGKPERLHTIGDAADLDHLPAAVSAALGARIAEQCGIAPTGPDSPEKEKVYMEILSNQERQHGPQNLAGKNGIRKALGLAPLRKRDLVDVEKKEDLEQGK